MFASSCAGSQHEAAGGAFFLALAARRVLERALGSRPNVARVRALSHAVRAADVDPRALQVGVGGGHLDDLAHEHRGFAVTSTSSSWLAYWGRPQAAGASPTG